MVSLRRDDCLAHPVIEKFVELKWNSSSVKRWYLLNILLYIIFLVCFTTHIILHTEDPSSDKSGGLIALSCITLIMCTVNVMKELLQAIVKIRRYRYIRDFSNYVEWVMYIATFVYFIPLSGKTERQMEAGAIAVFLAWINFIWFLKRFSRLGIYIIMAKKVFVSLLKVLPMVVLFLVAFAVAFHVLMSNDEGFAKFPESLLTTSVMITGEIDYRDVFLQAKNTPYRHLQQLFLVLFITVGSIVLMNLLVGLAVDDINKIMERSEAEERLHKASVVVDMERTLHSFPFLSSPPPLNNHREVIEETPHRIPDQVHKDHDIFEEKIEELAEKVSVLEELIKSNAARLENVLLEKIEAAVHSKEKS